MKYLSAFVEKMESEDLPQVVIDTFIHYYSQVIKGVKGLIFDADINSIAADEIADYSELAAYTDTGNKVLKHAVMIVLNGGLGTSMGLTSAKSLLKVAKDKTFLQIILEQAAATGVDLVFMNSFNTHADTMAAIKALQPEREPLFFLQHKFPKILQQEFKPAHWPANPELEWNPPGHGEVYIALHISGLLQALLDQGKRYAMIVNSDNLGASMDSSLLGYFAELRLPFMMEVAQRSPSDMKGGHLARHVNGRLILREIAQCPENEKQAFQDIQLYRFFNVNSLWVDLQEINDLIQKHNILRLPMILNPKTLDPRDPNSPAVYQIETAMGAAISMFKAATAVNVPVERFCPVKKCNELLAVRSDCFIFTPDGYLRRNPLRQLDSIQIQLDPKYYGNIDDFEKRFTHGAPSLIQCESLSIEGDVYFEKDVVIRGHVRICNLKADPAVITQGTIVEQDLLL